MATGVDIINGRNLTNVVKSNQTATSEWLKVEHQPVEEEKKDRENTWNWSDLIRFSSFHHSVTSRVHLICIAGFHIDKRNSLGHLGGFHSIYSLSFLFSHAVWNDLTVCLTKCNSCMRHHQPSSRNTCNTFNTNPLPDAAIKIDVVNTMGNASQINTKQSRSLNGVGAGNGRHGAAHAGRMQQLSPTFLI